jgi:hypothetical protein
MDVRTFGVIFGSTIDARQKLWLRKVVTDRELALTLIRWKPRFGHTLVVVERGR